jgi:hypothetical protein
VAQSSLAVLGLLTLGVVEAWLEPGGPSLIARRVEPRHATLSVNRTWVKSLPRITFGPFFDSPNHTQPFIGPMNVESTIEAS